MTKHYFFCKNSEFDTIKTLGAMLAKISPPGNIITYGKYWTSC